MIFDETVADRERDARWRAAAQRVELGAGRVNRIGHRVLVVLGAAIFVLAAFTGGDWREQFAGVVCMAAGAGFWWLDR